MSPLRSREVRALCEAIEHIHQETDLAQFPHRIFDVIGRMLPGVFIVSQEFNTRTREARSLSNRTAPVGLIERCAEIIPVEHQRGGSTRLLDRSTVLYVKAEGDYVRMYADEGRFLVRASLSEIEQRWAQYGFVRVHRSYVANLRRSTEIRPQLGGSVTIVMADGSEVPVARRQVAELRRRLRM